MSCGGLAAAGLPLRCGALLPQRGVESGEPRVRPEAAVPAQLEANVKSSFRSSFGWNSLIKSFENQFEKSLKPFGHLLDLSVKRTSWLSLKRWRTNSAFWAQESLERRRVSTLVC